MRLCQNVRLLPRTDPSYLSFCSAYANQNLRLGPRGLDGNRIDVAKWVEDCCRSELKAAFRLMDKDIISWQKKTSEGRLIQCYKEVDGVFKLEEPQKSLLLVEVKSSQSKSSVTSGKQQVKKNLALTQTTELPSRCLLILADCRDLDAVIGKPCQDTLEALGNEATVFYDFASFFEAKDNYEFQVIILNAQTVKNLVKKYGHPEELSCFSWWDEI